MGFLVYCYFYKECLGCFAQQQLLIAICVSAVWCYKMDFLNHTVIFYTELHCLVSICQSVTVASN